MKNLLAALSFFVIFSGAANAFQLQAQCQFNQFQGECTVTNLTFNVASCQLQIQGLTRSGAYFYGYENVNLFPGQMGYAYVNANNGYIDPLISVSGFANCVSPQ